MDNTTNNNTESEPKYVKAELVEMSEGPLWEWRDVRPVRPRRKWRLPVLLFVATCLSTLYAGTLENVLAQSWQAGMFSGLRYAVPVMVILICHEMGHFIQAYRYGVYASLPYFIPMPFSPPLEAAVLPLAEHIEAAVRDVLSADHTRSGKE